MVTTTTHQPRHQQGHSHQCARLPRLPGTLHVRQHRPQPANAISLLAGWGSVLSDIAGPRRSIVGHDFTITSLKGTGGGGEFNHAIHQAYAMANNAAAQHMPAPNQVRYGLWMYPALLHRL